MGRRITLETVKNELSEISPDIEVLAAEYKGCNHPLKCRCKECENIWYPVWDNLKQGKGCMECRRKKGNAERRMSIEEVRFLANEISSNLIIFEDEYINENTKMKCGCTNCNSKFLLNWRSIRNGVNCTECTKEEYFQKRRHTIEHIETYLKKNHIPIKPVSDNYNNAHEPIEFKCDDCDTVFKKSWTNIKTLKQYCPMCGIKKRSGSNHPNFNPTLTEEERSKTRLLMYGKKYMAWCSNVHKKSGFSCRVCNTNKDIIAHHLYSYSTHKELRLSVENGVTLCRTHHKEFHKKYGYRNNTKEQFEDYLKHAQ